MTDLEIYEQRPDIKALNDEYVQLGQRAADLVPALAKAHVDVESAETAARDAIAVAQKAFDQAKAKLNAVTVEQNAAVSDAKRALAALERETADVRTKRQAVQNDHNQAIASFRSVEDAKAAVTE